MRVKKKGRGETIFGQEQTKTEDGRTIIDRECWYGLFSCTNAKITYDTTRILILLNGVKNEPKGSMEIASIAAF